MVNNLNGYNRHVRKYKKKYSYKIAMRALRDASAHKGAFNSLISELKRRNPCWDMKSVNGRGSTARTLFTEENSDGLGLK